MIGFKSPSVQYSIGSKTCHKHTQANVAKSNGVFGSCGVIRLQFVEVGQLRALCAGARLLIKVWSRCLFHWKAESLQKATPHKNGRETIFLSPLRDRSPRHYTCTSRDGNRQYRSIPLPSSFWAVQYNDDDEILLHSWLRPDGTL